MSDIKFLYIGWCKGKTKGVEHDKIWTAFKVGDKYYAGWGARGKTIRFKKHINRYELDRVTRAKEKKYGEVDSFQLFTIFPYFEGDVEKYLTFSKLTNTVM